MGRNRLASIFAAFVAVLLLVPASGFAASGDAVIQDCSQDGHLDGHYTVQQLRNAQSNLPSDIDQYTDCRDVIAQALAQAQAAGRGGGGTGGSGGGAGGGQSTTAGSPKPNEGNPALATKSGAYAPSQADKQAYDRAVTEASVGGAVPGGLSIPTAGGFAPAGASNSIPLPVLLALVAVGLLIAATSAMVARRRLPAIARVARSVIRR
jgi:hypothetical protein